MGFVEGDLSQIYDLGITKVFSTGTALAELTELKQRCKSDLAGTMEKIIKQLNHNPRLLTVLLRAAVFTVFSLCSGTHSVLQ
ncbi:MAG: hypothetical protein PHC91_10705 [Eubacteriales bacterium]|nr:hypothetical protein [Eubacteriales bacterium]